MVNNKRKTIEGRIDKASNKLNSAKEHSKHSTQYSEAIQAAQECVELSVKSVLSLLEVNFPPSHEWDQDKKKFAAIATQIQRKQLLESLSEQYIDHIVNLPRLLFLMNFWGKFYITAKYGFEVEFLASAKDLFKKEDAELAIKHAEECYQAASHIRYIDNEKLATLLSNEEAA